RRAEDPHRDQHVWAKTGLLPIRHVRADPEPEDRASDPERERTTDHQDDQSELARPLPHPRGHQTSNGSGVRHNAGVGASASWTAEGLTAGEKMRKTCPRCKKRVRVNAIRCRGCGYAFPEGRGPRPVG